MRKFILFLLLIQSSLIIAQSPQNGWEMDFPQDNFSDDALLDLSSLNEEVAGENGFISLSPDGEDFVNGIGEEVKFWASGGGNVFEGAEYVQYAKFLAKKGVNMVRFHGDVVSVTDDINEPNAEELDKIWRMVAVMKEEGIYSTISPFWAGHAPDLNPDWGLGDYAGDISPWALMYFNETFKNAYKNWVEVLFTTENPYTGIPLKDDPAVGLIQIKNEDGIFFWTIQAVEPSLQQEIDQQYYQWLIDKYGSIENAYNAWGGVQHENDNPANQQMGTYIIWEATQDQSGGKDQRISDQMHFYADVQRGFYEEIYNHLRDIGCQQLINATNWKTASPLRLFDLERYTNAVTDVMAVNRYYSPGHLGPNSGWRIEPGHHYVGASALSDPTKLPINIKQVEGKPFLVTESGWNLPHKYQAEGPFLISSYMALTGVDAFYWFSPTSTGIEQNPYFTFTRVENQFPMYRWTVSTPGQMSMFPANALMYRNGYIQPGATVVHEERTIESLYQREIPIISEENSFDPNRDTGNPISSGGDTEISPLAYLTGQVEVVYGTADNAKTVDNQLEEWVDFQNKTVTSSTGELVWDYGDSLVILDAPAAKGLCGFPGETSSFAISDVTIETLNDYLVVNVVSMDGKPVNEASSVLIQIGTRYEPKGWRDVPATFERNDEQVEGFEIRNVGAMPWKAASSYVSVTLQNPNIQSAYLLDVNGYIDQEIYVDKSGANNSKKIDIPRNGMYIIANSTPATVNEPNVVTDLEDLGKAEFKVYPNPSRGLIRISFGEHHSGFDRIEILNLQGKLVKAINQFVPEIEFSAPNGLYVVQLLEDGRLVERQKVLIQR